MFICVSIAANSSTNVMYEKLILVGAENLSTDRIKELLAVCYNGSGFKITSLTKVQLTVTPFFNMSDLEPDEEQEVSENVAIVDIQQLIEILESEK